MLKLLLECWRNGSTLAETAKELQALARDIERQQLELRLEWGDVLDKLMAREDRQRKRDKKAVAEAVQVPEDPQQVPLFNQQRRLLGRR